MSAPYTAQGVGNEFIALSNFTATPLQIIKWVYFANGYYLAFAQQPLIDEMVEAWKYGPVIPSLYHELKIFGNEPVKFLLSLAGSEEAVRIPVSDSTAQKVIQAVWKAYGKFTGPQLTTITHKDGTPWDEVNRRHGGNIPRNADIPLDLLESHFKEKVRLNLGDDGASPE